MVWTFGMRGMDKNLGNVVNRSIPLAINDGSGQSFIYKWLSHWTLISDGFSGLTAGDPYIHRLFTYQRTTWNFLTWWRAKLVAPMFTLHGTLGFGPMPLVRMEKAFAPVRMRRTTYSFPGDKWLHLGWPLFSFVFFARSLLGRVR